MMPNDEHFMKLALAEAQKAFDAGEVPVGAIIVAGERIIARGHNMVEKLNDATAHAEMIAITSAFNQIGAKYLTDATLYVTVEPCLMCTGAIYWSKLDRIVWGADDEKNGHRRITGENWAFHPKSTITRGILSEESAQMMKAFFRARR
jgi:tRNA(adenine34) deaminase